MPRQDNEKGASGQCYNSAVKALNLIKQLLIGLTTIVIAGVVGACVFIFLGGNIQYEGQQLIIEEGAVITPLFLTPFNGTVPSNEPPIGVMIDNELLARSFQKGLSFADFVYEAPTEGNITRFLAIFSPERLPEKIGPIRSARTYFLDWIHEYDGVYTHVGGNPDALARLMKEKIFNADQFYLDKYFRRENVGQTPMEHTMFTGAIKLKQMIADQRWSWNPPAHLMDREATLRNMERYPAANKITINFGLYTYTVGYEYDAASGLYLRSQAKLPHIDHLNNKRIGVKIVVIQHVKSWANGDREMSMSMKTISNGEATVFQNGHAVEATWKKETLDGPTQFFDKKTGVEIIFAQTPTWFEILVETDKLIYE
ncbi:DUF3048 domain-containing protein [Candidatus Peregrinibacteria bacterium]|nr:DUF3048 domain-containing protein [Candidatus Peregrinibacteria bacterium]